MFTLYQNALNVYSQKNEIKHILSKFTTNVRVECIQRSSRVVIQAKILLNFWLKLVPI